MKRFLAVLALLIVVLTCAFAEMSLLARSILSCNDQELVAMAEAFGLSENLIGLTIVSCVTSLPELVTSIAAARKNELDMAIGNVVGSNIFNL